MTNSRATAMVWSVIKQADEQVTSSDTLQDDDELKIDASKLLASTQYGFEIFLLFKCHATPDLQYDIELNGNTGLRSVSTYSPTSSTGTTNLSTPGVIICDDTIQCALIRGHVLTGSTPGSIIFRWAQNTSDANTTIIKAGSHMTVFRTTV